MKNSENTKNASKSEEQNKINVLAHYCKSLEADKQNLMEIAKTQAQTILNQAQAIKTLSEPLGDLPENDEGGEGGYLS